MRKNLLTMDIILAKEIKFMLEKNGYRPGDKLPSERILAEKFNVQRQTIRNALALLVQEKYIHPVQRKGYFVSPTRILISTRQFTRNFIPAERDSGMSCRLHGFEKIFADKQLSSKMLIPENTPVFQITKVYYENGTPLNLDCSYTPADIYPGVTPQQVEKKKILNLLLDDLQIEIAKSNQKVTLIYVNEKEAALLQVPPGSPMMKYKGLVYDKQGRLINFFENIMKMDDFAFIREAEKRDTWNKTKA